MHCCKMHVTDMEEQFEGETVGFRMDNDPPCPQPELERNTRRERELKRTSGK